MVQIRYQEYSDGIIKFDNFIFISYDLLLISKSGIQNNLPISSAVRIRLVKHGKLQCQYRRLNKVILGAMV